MIAHMMRTAYVFNCPVHGPETTVMCFRAFGLLHRYLWEKFAVEYHAVAWDDADELARYLNSMQEKVQEPNHGR